MIDMILSRELNFYSMMLRIFLAVVAGGVIGFERDKKHRAAGFRTFILVAIGSAMTMILSQYFDIMLSTDWAETSKALGIRTDVSRVGAQVINGVGFLGAGTIIVTGRHQVKGLTTAAGLWASACMGLAVGAGFYECVLVGFVLILMSMTILPIIEDAVLARARNMNIYIEIDSIDILGVVVSRLKSRDVAFYDVDIENEKHSEINQISVFLSVGLPRGTQHTEVLADISTIDGIQILEEI